MGALTTATVRTLGARVLPFAEVLEDPSAHKRLEGWLDARQTRPFQLVVVGEIKKGKSSFINALLGQPELLPALSDVATSTVYQVGWGEALTYRVHFQPQDPRAPAETTPPLQVIAAEAVATYGTEDGNPGNRRGVDFIAVELPHPLLKQGLTIIDTPGLGGLFKSHAEILWRYAPAADAVFFVLDSVEAVASRPEMEALERLRRMTPLLFFVQTKTDLVDEAQWREWQQRNLAILADTLGKPSEALDYFPISAKLKQAADRRQSAELLQDSGYAALLNFLQADLMALKDAYQASQILTEVMTEAQALHQRGLEQLRALSARTHADLDRLDQEAQTARDAFRAWKDTCYRDLKAEFERRSRSLKREQTHELQNQLDSGPTGPVVGPILAHLRGTEDSAEQLVARADEFRSWVIDRCAGEMFAIHDAYHQRMHTLIAQTTERMGETLPVNLDASTQRLRLDREPTSLETPMHWFERARALFRGGAAVSGMVGYGLVGWGAVFAPVTIPVAATALIGAMLAGLFFSHKALEDKRREQVLSKLQTVLSENVRVAQRQAVQHFNDLADRFEYAAIEAFNQIVEIRTARLDHQLAQIDLARRQTTEQRATSSAALQASLAQLEALLNDLDQAATQSVLPLPDPATSSPAS